MNKPTIERFGIFSLRSVFFHRLVRFHSDLLGNRTFAFNIVMPTNVILEFLCTSRAKPIQLRENQAYLHDL